MKPLMMEHSRVHAAGYLLARFIHAMGSRDGADGCVADHTTRGLVEQNVAGCVCLAKEGLWRPGFRLVDNDSLIYCRSRRVLNNAGWGD